MFYSVANLNHYNPMQAPERVFSVSQINRHVRTMLEYEMGGVSVSGEISNLSKPSSGHFYFTLKDEAAQLRCVFFRNRHGLGRKTLENGQQVVAHGKLSLYEARGDYQLIIEQLDSAGIGDLHQQFERLKEKLKNAGLFETAKKKPIPRFPKVIGVISSATSAALRDILTTLKRRYPIANILVYASEVQGKQAAESVIKALQKAQSDKKCDVLILARGGGSIEDLWGFNDERLAHLMAECSIPIITGIGHETDFTIADFVADLRAATPTAAAESATPDAFELNLVLQNIQASLISAISRILNHQRLILNHLIKTLHSPQSLINHQWQALDYLTKHLHQGLGQLLANKIRKLEQVDAKLQRQNPASLIQKAQVETNHLKSRLVQLIHTILKDHRQRLAVQFANLHAFSPLATLDRGYAIAMKDHHVLSDVRTLKLGDEVDVKLAKGAFKAQVKNIQMAGIEEDATTTE